MADRAFGPRIDINYRSFDFTLQFEDVIFTCLPAAVLLCLAPFNILDLLRKPCIFSVQSRLLACKMTALVALFAAQLALVVVRFQSKVFRTDVSLAADILSFVATAMLLASSFIDHQRSNRPSSLISLYLSAYSILSIAKIRTSWLIDAGGRTAATTIVCFALAILTLVVESIKKKTITEPTKRHNTPEQYSGFWNRAIFAWLAATFRLGYSRIISVDDLPALDSKLESEQLHRNIVATWNKYNRHDRHSLLRAIFRCFLTSFLSGVLPRLCLTAFTFSQPFLLNTTVNLVGEKEPNKNYGKGLIGAWALVFMGMAVSNSVYHYQNIRFTARLRGSLMSIVYQNSLRIREVEQGSVTAIAILGADVQRIVSGLLMLHEIWGSLLDVAIATWLLERKLSLACLAPVLLVLAFIAATTKISDMANSSQRKWIEKVQDRLRVTSNALDSMKSVKMLGLSGTISDVIQTLRRKEIETSATYRKVLVGIILLSNTPIILAPTVTFAVYVIISVYWTAGALEVAQAFTSLTLISLLTMPVVLFIQVLPRVIQCVGCFDRIQEYCNYGTKPGSENGQPTDDRTVNSGDDDTLSATDMTYESVEIQKLSRSNGTISLKDESFQWKTDGPSILKNVSLDIEEGTFTALVGPVGSGKSTLLESILGETINGSPNFKRIASVSYCSQQPWLENKTVRDSIVGISDFDDKWYGTVKACCDLETDIEQLPNGDMTIVGSKGTSLSGGQKQRITLARAVYARSSVILLDDVFSGMDAHTIDIVSRRLIRPDGLFRKQKSTIVLATNNRNIIALADTIIALNDGEIVETGRPQNLLLNTDGYVSKLGLTITEYEQPEDAWEVEHTAPIAQISKDKEDSSVTDDQQRKNGEFAVYKYYLKSSGYVACAVYFIFVAIWMFLTEFSTVWLKWWSTDDATHPNRNVGMWMGVYAAFGIFGTLCACVACWVMFVRMISNSADQLHYNLLQSTLRAPFWFLTATDNGQLLNRFSQDLELIDMALPSYLGNYVTTAISCMVKLVILFIFSQYLGAAVPVIGTILYFLQRFYLKTSRQLRLLGIEAKAPLYTHFGDSVSGAATIRAFGWQPTYQARLYHLVDTFQRPEYLLLCVQRCLSFFLDTIVAILAVIVVATIITWRDNFDAGSVGVSLVMIIGFSTTLERVITSWTQMEACIGAVARIKSFVVGTESEDHVGLTSSMNTEWIKTGALQIEGLEASHSPTGELVLKDLSLSVEPGHHIAVCGRSGSGKTSLMLCILQMMDIRDGAIKIDGTVLSNLNCEEVRKALNVVPQDPFLMPGSVRFNVDPFGTASDANIAQALTRVGLWRIVEEQGGLDKEMDTSAWSAGQKQLICLARAMVKKSAVLILDEAMSNVDSEAEKIMQEIIDSEFKETTVLAIMHRLDHIERYDRVVLMDHGKVLEYDEPAKLMAEDSKFAELYKSHRK